jgi:hypothetical protein
MCLNCGCGDYNDDMGDKRNVTLQSLADAVIAGNDGDVQQFLEEMNKAMGRVTKEDLQKEVDKKKGQGSQDNEGSTQE